MQVIRIDKNAKIESDEKTITVVTHHSGEKRTFKKEDVEGITYEATRYDLYHREDEK